MDGRRGGHRPHHRRGHRVLARRRADGGAESGLPGGLLLSPPRSILHTGRHHHAPAHGSAFGRHAVFCIRPRPPSGARAWPTAWNDPATGILPLQGPAAEAVTRFGSLVFSTGLQLAMPVLALLVLLDIAFAVLGRLHAQLQLLSLSFAAKMLVALAFLASMLLDVSRCLRNVPPSDHVQHAREACSTTKCRTKGSVPRNRLSASWKKAGAKGSFPPAANFLPPCSSSRLSSCSARGPARFLERDREAGALLSRRRFPRGADPAHGLALSIAMLSAMSSGCYCGAECVWPAYH